MTEKKLEVLSAKLSSPEAWNGRNSQFNIEVKDFNGIYPDQCSIVIDHGDRKSFLHEGQVEENKEFYGIRGEFRFAFKRERNWMWPNKGSFNETYRIPKEKYEEVTGVLVTEVRISGIPCFVKREYAQELLEKFVPYAHIDENGNPTYKWGDRFSYEEQQRQHEERLASRKITAVEFRKAAYEVEAWVTLEDGSVEHVFSYFADEISFSEYELVGRSLKSAKELRHRKDVAYLRS